MRYKFRILLLLIPSLTYGQNSITESGLNDQVELYRYLGFDLGISSGIMMNAALAGSKNEPRISATGVLIPYTKGFNGNYRISYDASVRSLKGGIGVELEYYGKMKESNLRLLYSPKFTAKDKYTLAPVIGIEMGLAPLSSQRYLFGYTLGMLFHGSKTLAGFEVRDYFGYNFLFKAQLAQSFKINDHWKGSLMLHGFFGNRKLHEYIKQGELISSFDNDTINSIDFNTAALVGKLQYKHWIFGLGINHDKYFFEQGEEKELFYRYKRLRPILQLGYKRSGYEFMISTNTVLVSYTLKK